MQTSPNTPLEQTVSAFQETHKQVICETVILNYFSEGKSFLGSTKQAFFEGLLFAC